MSKTKIAFIINPISGVGKQNKVVPYIENNISKDKFDLSIIYTQKNKLADEIVKENFTEFDVFIAVGGDGSVNETAKNLIGTDKIIGIIPAGSGNGFARHFSISLDFEKAIATINNLNISKIDTGKINNIPFIAFAGIGFDAQIANLFKSSKTRGLFTYIKLTVLNFIKYKERTYDLIFDGNNTSKKALFIAFANINQYGNNAKTAPSANALDGLFNISIVKKPDLLSGVKLIYDLFNNNFENNSFVHSLMAKNIKVNQVIKYINLDGESIEINDKLKIEIKPLSLNLITPINHG